ncbi:MAG: thioredoxin domain-containing protein [Candidatus Peregrinibacteria bacterium]|nr:thioredoxin domain-containing protein [Candidatus Peregrinibacteria bacterium]MCB9808501.1 thioredoxin domain-containing protein [Candidatus Peribacteria bacterium]
MANSPSNHWFGVSMVLIGIIAGYGVAVGTNAPSPSAAPKAVMGDNPSPTPSAPAPTVAAGDLPEIDFDRDHIRGNKDASIFVVEYSDFECPFCSRHHPTLTSLLESNDDIAWVYRHFPLSFHPNATPLALASECVWEQGGNDAFWSFADMIFEKGADASKIAEYATAAGVDGNKVQTCVDNSDFSDYVANDMAGGSAAGVSGTPGNIIINIDTDETRLVSGAQPLASFQSAVDALR